MAYYFISDLHLDKSQAATINAFIDFLQNTQDAKALYILGDFVEYWVGDDNYQHGLDNAFDALKTFAQTCPTYLMHGNRDFLIGQEFAEQYNIKLIDDPYAIQIDNQHLILSHGDLLCTDDKEYAAFRKEVRSTEWQTAFLNQSLKERIDIAENLRQQSQAAMQLKPEVLMDVNQEAVEKCFIDNNVSLMIHGHTHRPAIHNHLVADRHCQRIVLSDWHQKPSYLRIDNNQAELVCDDFIKSTSLVA